MGFALFLVYIALTFVRPQELYASLQTLPIMSVASIAAVGAALVSRLLGRGPTWRAPQIYLVVTFMVWAVISFLAATRWWGGASGVVAQLHPSLLIFFLAFLNVDTVGRLRATAAMLALLALYLVGQGAMAYHFGYQSKIFLLRERLVGAERLEVPEEDEEGEGEAEAEGPSAGRAADAEAGVVIRIRSVGFLHDPNDLAQALVAIAPFLVALRRPGRRFRNTFLVWAPAVAIVYGVSLTRSRGALVALLALVFYTFRHRLGRVLSLSIAGIATLGLIALGFSGGRALSMDESSSGRILAWSEGLHMLRTWPIWGVGYGNFVEWNELVAHNSFVHCFAETGLVGYFFWLWAIALTFTEVAALSKRGDEDQESALAPWGRALHLSLVAFLTASLFLSRTYSPVLFLILGLGVALADMARRRGITADTTPLMRWVPRIVGIEVVSIFLVWLTVIAMT